MEITREYLEKTKRNLQAQQRQLEANLNAAAGALQLVDALLKDLDTPEPSAPANPKES